jgi:hypothetical protein
MALLRPYILMTFDRVLRTTTTILNMLILIFRCKIYIGNRFSKLTPYEIAL